ncbi:hypothetical protein Tco_0502666, partial [Tanacetum coccineum]
TILQISSAILHISNIDYMYIKSYSFRLFSSLPGVLTPVRGESLKILNGFDVSLPVSHLLWSSQSFGHQKAINEFDMPLPVAVCLGLVNPLPPRKGVVDWKSAKQSIFATSSAEDEYIAAFDASKEAVVVPTIEKPINMYCDNTGAIAIANESGITKGARHFCAKVHYLREVIEFSDIKLEKVHTDDNLANPFTKALAFPKHSELTRNIGMLPASSLM